MTWLLQRPGLFYWHTEATAEQTMVSDGKKVTLWDPDLEQATIKKLDPRLTQTPALLLSGDVSKISESFDISAKESRRRDRVHPQAENPRTRCSTACACRSAMAWSMTCN